MAETLAGAGHVLCVDGDPGAHGRGRGFVHLADISETAVGWDSGLEWRPAAASCFCGGEEASAHGRAREWGGRGSSVRVRRRRHDRCGRPAAHIHKARCTGVSRPRAWGCRPRGPRLL